MSTEKVNDSQEIIILKLKSRLGLKRDSQLAEMLGLSTGDFSNRKRRGTLLKVLSDHFSKQGINIYDNVESRKINGKEESQSMEGQGLILSEGEAVFIEALRKLKPETRELVSTMLMKFLLQEQADGDNSDN